MFIFSFPFLSFQFIFLGVQENEMQEKCVLYDVSNGKCGGGVIALDGKTGAVLWKYWTRKDVLYLDCSQNVNTEKTRDCLVAGRGGVSELLFLAFIKSISLALKKHIKWGCRALINYCFDFILVVGNNHLKKYQSFMNGRRQKIIQKNKTSKRRPLLPALLCH